MLLRSRTSIFLVVFALPVLGVLLPAARSVAQSSCDKAVRALYGDHDYDLAITYFEQCLTDGGLLSEQRAGTYGNLCSAYSGSADSGSPPYDRAIIACSRAIRLNPTAFSYFSRGHIHMRAGKHDRAIPDFERAITIDPTDAYAYNDLAWVLATSMDVPRNGARAVSLAEQAVALGYEHEADNLDTLAAAYAEAGRFADAVKTEMSAIELLRTQGSTEYIAEFTARLSTYKQGQPWRE